MFLSSVSEHSEFIFQHGHFIELYTIDFEEDIPEEELEELEKHEAVVEAEEDAIDKLEAHGSGSESESHRESVVSQKKFPMKPKIRLVQVIDVEEKDDQGHHGKNKIKSKIQEGIKFEVHPIGQHHAHPKQYLVLNDHVNLYQIELKSEKVTVFERKYC